MFLAKFNCTCCLLKMALEAAWSINSSTFIFSTQRKGQFAGHSCYRVDGPHELLLSQPQSAALKCPGTLHVSAKSAGKLSTPCKARKGSQRAGFLPG